MGRRQSKNSKKTRIRSVSIQAETVGKRIRRAPNPHLHSVGRASSIHDTPKLASQDSATKISDCAEPLIFSMPVFTRCNCPLRLRAHCCSVTAGDSKWRLFSDEGIALLFRKGDVKHAWNVKVGCTSDEFEIYRS